MTTSVRRPALITVLAVLVVIGGVIAIITGIVAFSAVGTFTWAGVIPIVLGLVYLAVAKGLLDGNPAARIVVAVVTVLQLLAAIVSLSGEGTAMQRSSAVGSVIFPILILVVLFLPASNAFFGRRR